MKFVRNINHKNDVEDLGAAIRFLRDAYEQGKVSEIENMEEVLDALDVVEQLERALRLLEENHIAF